MSYRDIGKIAVIALVLVLAVLMTGKIGSMHGEEEARMVQDAIREATLTCYAVEGAYPESLDYLTEHYGLQVNTKDYYITYEAFAENLPPDVLVQPRSGKEAP